MIFEDLSGGKKDHCRSNKKKRKLGIKPGTNGIKSYRCFALAVVTAAVAFTQGKSIISSHLSRLMKASSFPPNSRRFWSQEFAEYLSWAHCHSKRPQQAMYLLKQALLPGPVRRLSMDRLPRHRPAISCGRAGSPKKRKPLKQRKCTLNIRK